MVPNTAFRKSSAVQKWAKLSGFLCDRPIYTIYLANFIKQLIRFRPNWRCSKFMPCGNTTHHVPVDEKRFFVMKFFIYTNLQFTNDNDGNSGVGTMGTGGVHCTPQVQDLYPPSQRCGLCQKFKQTTLTTRLYKVRTNLYPPPLTKTFRRAWTATRQNCKRKSTKSTSPLYVCGNWET